MTSPVNWSLLGLVIERSSYGLEYFNRYERVYGDVLPVSSESHIYTALDALEDRGLIEVIGGAGGGRQPKPHYQATLFGIRSYEDWLVAQVAAQRRKQDLWTRQMAVFARDPDAALQLLDRFEHAHLGHVTSRAKRPAKRTATDVRGTLVAELVAEQQRIADGGMVKWLRYAVRKVEMLAEGLRDGAPGA